MAKNQAQQDRIDRAIADVKEKHPAAELLPLHPNENPEEWIEFSFYGSELHLYVWSKAEGKTIAHYTDLVDDLEHAVTAPQNARQR